MREQDDEIFGGSGFTKASRIIMGSDEQTNENTNVK